MDKIILLGTGHAMTVECFNTCFVYSNEQGNVLIDTGGGQQLVGQMRAAGVSASDINHVFISHRHTDHLLGLPWLVRMRMKCTSQVPLVVYAHEELCRQAQQLLFILFPELKEQIKSTVLFEMLHDGNEKCICGRKFRFYDVHSNTCLQYGFCLYLENGDTFVFNGDVPVHESNYKKLSAPKYLMHEAFALECQMNHNPGKHASVKQAAKCAQTLNAENLIIVHGSDRNLLKRSEQYKQEAAAFFNGAIYVPNDLDIIEL